MGNENKLDLSMVQDAFVMMHDKIFAREDVDEKFKVDNLCYACAGVCVYFKKFFVKPGEENDEGFKKFLLTVMDEMTIKTKED